MRGVSSEGPSPPKTKFESKIARSAQLLVVVHDPRDEEIYVNHQLYVGALLQLMVAAKLGLAIAPPLLAAQSAILV